MPIKRKENKEMVRALKGKKSIFLPLVVTVLFLGGISGMAIAADEPVDRAARAAEEKEAKERTLAQEKMRKLVQAAKEKINNTSWQIDLRESMSNASDQKGGKGKKGAAALDKDTLNFRDNKIESSSLLSNGFTPTNFTVRLKGKDNDIIVWETMQTSADKGVAFWRGEIDNDVMRGVLSWQLDEQNKQDYSFVSSQKGAPAPAAVEAPVAEATEGEAVLVQEQAVIETPAAQEVKAETPNPAETKPADIEDTPKKKSKGFAW
ncbi:MAG: hypothetical protein V1682_03665 [Candidatus Omnitrophota bacterium]